MIEDKENLTQYVKKLADATNLNDYKSALKEAARKQWATVPGSFYTMKYRYKSLRSDGKNGNDFAFYDTMPLVFVLSVDKTSIEALNLHFLPVDVRIGFLDLLNRMMGGKLADGKRVNLTRMSIMNIPIKWGFALRHYSLDRVFEMKMVKPDWMWDLCEFTANTYVQVNYRQVAKMYKLFRG